MSSRRADVNDADGDTDGAVPVQACSALAAGPAAVAVRADNEMKHNSVALCNKPVDATTKRLAVASWAVVWLIHS